MHPSTHKNTFREKGTLWIMDASNGQETWFFHFRSSSPCSLSPAESPMLGSCSPPPFHGSFAIHWLLTSSHSIPEEKLLWNIYFYWCIKEKIEFLAASKTWKRGGGEKKEEGWKEGDVYGIEKIEGWCWRRWWNWLVVGGTRIFTMSNGQVWIVPHLGVLLFYIWGCPGNACFRNGKVCGNGIR